MRISTVVAAAATVVLVAGGLTASTRQRPGSLLLRGHARPVATGHAPGPAAFGAADTRFGLDLLTHLNGRDGNVVFSPASVATALGMAYLGARGETGGAMAHTLRLPATGDRLLAGLHGRTEALRALPHLHTADTLWADPGVRTRRDYLDRLATGYDAAVRQVPMATDPAGAAATVNETIDTQTHGLIGGIVSPGDLDGTRWLLTDAVYLKARWKHPFDAADTHTGPFHGTHGTGSARYMHRTGTMRYVHADGWSAVALPYRDGRLEMLALLPDGTDAVPSADTLRSLSDGLRPRQVTLALPRVHLSFGADLVEPLRELGMGRAFGPGADFSGLSPSAGPIGVVRHRATLRVGERGTEAAAVTAVGIEATAARSPGPTIAFNHPYLVLIRDTRSHEPLFLAHIHDPNPH